MLKRNVKKVCVALLASALVFNTLLTTVYAEDGVDSNTSSDGQPGDSPSGGQPDGQPGDLPSGEQPGGQPGGNAGGSSGVTSYDAVTEYSSDTTISGSSYTSTGTDENAVLVSGGKVILNNVTVDRNSSTSTGGDNASFYGVGAAVLTTGGTSYISGSTVTTDAAGGAGVFAYGDGIVYVSDSTIKTTQNTSGGIHAAGGGTLYAWNLNVDTLGESAAAIRSDRGGGTMIVNGGTYTSNGTGSPAIYCTADISANNAVLTANNSEAICIEGLNSLRLFDCNLTGNMKDDSQNDTTWNIILYQSMSGDSQAGNSTFEMSGGKLTAKNGGMFYTTNTESTITLSNVDITYADDSEFFLQCTGNSNQRGWGSTGSNGANCLFTAIHQEMQGNVIWDSISELDFYITSQSSLSGAFVQDESCAGSGGNGYANVYISSDSEWVVTGDSIVTNLYNAGTITDVQGNTVTVKDTDGNVYVKGNSEYVITVSSYSIQENISGAFTISSWSSYEVSEPAELTADYSATEPDANTNGSSATTGTTTDNSNAATGTATDISGTADVTLSKTSYTYNGKQKKPGIIVKAGGTGLVKDKDYTVLYENNTKVGTASVVVTGIGNYKGTVTKAFRILPKGTSVSGKITPKSKGFTVKWRKQSTSTTGYQIQYSTGKKFTKKTTVSKTVKKSSTKLTVKKLKAKKKYYVRIRTYKTVNGKKYYSGWSGVKVVTTQK